MNHVIPGYTIQRLSPENTHYLKVLFKAVYRKSVSTDFFLRKYDTKKLGCEYIGYFALTAEGLPAAFYGVIPCQFNLKDSVVLAAQSADTMTHPQHRKKGLFVELANTTYQLARQNHIQFIFGFPNQNSYPGFVKLQWDFTSREMQLFTFNGSSIPFGRFLNKVRPVKQAITEIATTLIKKIDAQNFFAHEVYSVRHDTLFLEYKKYSTTYFAKLNDSYIWFKNDGALKIGYVNLESGKTIDWLLGEITKVAHWLGCSKIFFMTSANSRLYQQLSKIATSRNALPIGFYPLSNIAYDWNNIIFEYCDIDIF